MLETRKSFMDPKRVHRCLTVFFGSTSSKVFFSSIFCFSIKYILCINLEQASKHSENCINLRGRKCAHEPTVRKRCGQFIQRLFEWICVDPAVQVPICRSGFAWLCELSPPVIVISHCDVSVLNWKKITSFNWVCLKGQFLCQSVPHRVFFSNLFYGSSLLICFSVHLDFMNLFFIFHFSLFASRNFIMKVINHNVLLFVP